MAEVTAGQKRRARKNKYIEKLKGLLDSYSKILVVGMDNVGSFQMQKIRISLRKKAEILMGKNTLMKMIIRQKAESNPQLEGLIPLLRGNVGFVFTNGDIQEIRSIITQNKVPAAAKSGTFAPVDVYVPAGPTGLDPGQTSFFQALDIATKIARGSIEIVNTVNLIKEGEKVTSSAVALLGKLDIKPFFYGVVALHVYDAGSVFPINILDITEEELLSKFFNGVRKLTSICLAARYPTEASIPHTIANGFKKLASIALTTNFKIPILDQLVARSSAPKPEAKDEKKGDKGGKGKDDKGGDKGGKGKGKDKEEEKPKEEKPQEEEEEEVVGGFSDLFGGGGDD